MVLRSDAARISLAGADFRPIVQTVYDFVEEDPPLPSFLKSQVIGSATVSCIVQTLLKTKDTAEVPMLFTLIYDKLHKIGMPLLQKNPEL